MDNTRIKPRRYPRLIAVAKARRRKKYVSRRFNMADVIDNECLLACAIVFGWRLAQ